MSYFVSPLTISIVGKTISMNIQNKHFCFLIFAKNDIFDTCWYCMYFFGFRASNLVVSLNLLSGIMCSGDQCCPDGSACPCAVFPSIVCRQKMPGIMVGMDQKDSLCRWWGSEQVKCARPEDHVQWDAHWLEHEEPGRRIMPRLRLVHGGAAPLSRP